MQVRKLVKSGHSSLVAALPRDWIKRKKLKAGDLLYIKEETDKLIIEIESKKDAVPEKNEIVINIDNKDHASIVHDLNSAYLDNYKFVVIKGKTLNQVINLVKDKISNLIALELVDESSEKIVAKNFLDIHDSHPKIVTRRMDNIIRSMLIDCRAALSDYSLVQTIINRDIEVNRLSYLSFKILKQAYLDPSLMSSLEFKELDVLRYWDLNNHLEKIGDRLKSIVGFFPRLDKKSKVILVNLLKKLELLYLNTMVAFYQQSYILSDKIFKEKKEVVGYIKNNVDKTKSTVFSQVAINAYEMVHHINDIARIVRYLN